MLRDQFLFLVRAGFDTFEVVKPADALAFEEATRRYSVFFQPTGDGRVTVARVRGGREAQAPHRGAGALNRVVELDTGRV